MKSGQLTIILIGLLLFFSCEHNAATEPPGKTSGPLSEIARAVSSRSNCFGLNLFKQIVDDTCNTNILISPLSVAMALGMTYNGSSGTTTEAMGNTLGFGDLSFEEINQAYRDLINNLQIADDDVTFQIANSIWYRDNFAIRDSFITTNMTYFDALVQDLDFSRPDAADIINAWVNDNTDGKISEIVTPPIDIATVMFLINAIYFKGSWTYEFNPDLTETAPFYLPDNGQTECQLMSYKCEQPYFDHEQFQAVDLPYGNGNFRMMVILPYSNVDLDSIIAGLDDSDWNTWLNQFEQAEINLYLPKFKLEYENELKDILSAMGMAVAFSPGEADFSGINRDYQLFISKIKHKTYIEVHEEGTEAAAATSVEVCYTSVGGGDSTPVMRVDRPFIFAIHETETGAILFIGKIQRPEYEE